MRVPTGFDHVWFIEWGVVQLATDADEVVQKVGTAPIGLMERGRLLAENVVEASELGNELEMAESIDTIRVALEGAVGW